jgi:hypothetical protein
LLYEVVRGSKISAELSVSEVAIASRWHSVTLFDTPRLVAHAGTNGRIATAVAHVGVRVLPRGIIRWVWSPFGGGCIRRTHFLSLIFLNQSITSLGHAGARCFIRRSSVKIGVAKGYVSLALLK